MRWVLADDSSNPTYHVRVSTDMDELGYRRTSARNARDLNSARDCVACRN